SMCCRARERGAVAIEVLVPEPRLTVPDHRRGQSCQHQNSTTGPFDHDSRPGSPDLARRDGLTGLNENGTRGDGDLTGVVELDDRIEQQLIEIADEVNFGEPDELGSAACPGQTQRFAADESPQGQSAALNRSRSAGIRRWGAAFHRWPFTDG